MRAVVNNTTKANMNTHTETRCSWCDKENGVHVEGVSHGICKKHKAQVLAEYGINDAANVARTFKDLRPVRNDNLDSSFEERLEAENIGWRTVWACIGIGITAAAAAVGAVLVMTL